MAAGINVAATRTVLATPVVLVELTARADLFPCVCLASLASLYATREASLLISAARPRKSIDKEDLRRLSFKLPPRYNPTASPGDGLAPTPPTRSVEERAADVDARGRERRLSRERQPSSSDDDDLGDDLGDGAAAPPGASVGDRAAQLAKEVPTQSL